jgi:hypothetical protein
MPALPDYCFGNAAYVAAHCRGVIILISRSTYSPAEYFYPDNYPGRRDEKTSGKIVQKQKGKPFQASLFYHLEREKSLELSTSTLARLRSTN